MVDPTNITNYNLTYPSLQEHLLFWVCAAGKNGRTAAKCLNSFLNETNYHGNLSPFQAIENIDFLSKEMGFPDLPYYLKKAGIGCFNQKAITMRQLVGSKLNIRTCPAEDLEKIYGIGMKTSRCFILHSRKDARYAGLDTHMLKHLREVGIENVPKSTPSSKKLYLTLEKEVLSLADKAGMSPADYDLKVWRHYSK